MLVSRLRQKPYFVCRERVCLCAAGPSGEIRLQRGHPTGCVVSSGGIYGDANRIQGRFGPRLRPLPEEMPLLPRRTCDFCGETSKTPYPLGKVPIGQKDLNACPGCETKYEILAFRMVNGIRALYGLPGLPTPPLPPSRSR